MVRCDATPHEFKFIKSDVFVECFGRWSCRRQAIGESRRIGRRLDYRQAGARQCACERDRSGKSYDAAACDDDAADGALIAQVAGLTIDALRIRRKSEWLGMRSTAAHTCPIIRLAAPSIAAMSARSARSSQLCGTTPCPM